MPISPEFTSVLSKNWKINFLQCYPNGNLKYTELCNFLQLTAAKHSVLGGISFNDMQKFNQAWVLSKMRVEINKMPKWKDEITVKTWIKSLENSRSIRCLEIHLGNQKLIGCQTFWAVFNTQTRRPETLVLPHQHFEKFENKNATTKLFSKINIQKEFKTIANKKVVLSDLDIVNHVNHVKYLEWCLDYLDYKTILNEEIQSFEMNFMKELSLSDEITIAKNENTFVINKEDKTCFALVLEK